MEFSNKARFFIFQALEGILQYFSYKHPNEKSKFLRLRNPPPWLPWADCFCPPVIIGTWKILGTDDLEKNYTWRWFWKIVPSAVKSIFMLITCYSYPWEFVRFFVRFIWIFIISKIQIFLFILKIISTWIFFGWFGSIRINFIWITIFIFTLTRRNILPRTPYSVKDTIIYS